jgi:hypothetical protein
MAINFYAEQIHNSGESGDKCKGLNEEKNQTQESQIKQTKRIAKMNRQETCGQE